MSKVELILLDFNICVYHSYQSLGADGSNKLSDSIYSTYKNALQTDAISTEITCILNNFVYISFTHYILINFYNSSNRK